MQFIVKADRVTQVRRPVGSTVTIVNQDAANDCYLDFDPMRLAATAPGAVPNGTKIAKGGGQVQFTSFPGSVYLRAAVDMLLEVQP